MSPNGFLLPRIDDEDLITWMRPAGALFTDVSSATMLFVNGLLTAFRDFRKLHRTITGPVSLAAGSKIVLNVNNGNANVMMIW